MYKQILAKIQEFDTIIIHTHQKPDGDAIGAQLGLKYALQANFPKKAIYAVGEQNERFGYWEVSIRLVTTHIKMRWLSLSILVPNI